LQFPDKWASEDRSSLERFQPIGTYQHFLWTAVSKTNLQSTERKPYLVCHPTRPSLTLSRLGLSSLPKYRQKPFGREGFLAGVLTTNPCCHLDIFHNLFFLFLHHCFRRFRFCSHSYCASLLSLHTCTLCFRCAICHINYLYVHIALMNTMHQKKRKSKSNQIKRHTIGLECPAARCWIEDNYKWRSHR